MTPLWEHGFYNWAQIMGRAPDGRPYFLEDREIIWANPSIWFPLSQTLTHALKYLRATLSSTSVTQRSRLKKHISERDGRD